MRRPCKLKARAAAFAVSALAWMLAACAPEVGSERWCGQMNEKPRGDWSTNEALDYARHCIFEGSDDE